SGCAYYYELQSESASTRVRIHLSFGADDISDEQSVGQKKVMEFVNKYTTKEDWHWFRPIGWTLDHENGEETLNDEVERILSEVIPRFEEELAEFLKNK